MDCKFISYTLLNFVKALSLNFKKNIKIESAYRKEMEVGN
jgi:hypothetical protein